MIVEMVSVFSMLVLCSYTDIRKKYVIILPCMGYGLAGIVFGVLQGTGAADIFVRVFPGLLLYALSRISKGEIGEGDAIVFMVMGIWLGVVRSIEIFVVALGATTLLMVPVLWFRKKSLKTQVPFIPFVTMAFVLLYWLEVI